MAKRKNVKPANVETVDVATVVEPTVSEVAPAAGPEPAPVDSAEESTAVSGAVPATQEETENPTRRHGGRQPKNTSVEAAEKPARKRGSRKTKEESAGLVKRGRQKAADEQPAKEAEKQPLLPRRSKMAIPDTMGIFIQYQGEEVDMTAIVEAVKADFVANSKHKRITTLKLYAKPEERTVYYVANDSYNGKITF